MIICAYFMFIREKQRSYHADLQTVWCMIGMLGGSMALIT